MRSELECYEYACLAFLNNTRSKKFFNLVFGVTKLGKNINGVATLMRHWTPNLTRIVLELGEYR